MIEMKHSVCVVFLSLFMLLPLRLWGQDGLVTGSVEDDYVRDAGDGFYFELMDVDVTVHANRTYDIVEQLDAYFVEPRHGIVREIPKRFWVNRDISEHQDSTKFKLFYNGMKLTDITVSEMYDEKDGDNIRSLRIGSIDREVFGAHHYRISYRLELPNDRVETSDLFFHSVVGTAWSCSMDSVHFTIHFDKEIPRESYEQLKIYVGQEGSKDDRAYDLVDYADSHTIEGSVLELPSYWGVTIDMPLPEGYFPIDDRSGWEYVAWIMAGFTLLLLLVLIFREVQGDERVPAVVAFRPSKGLTSADIGSLIDGEVDDEDLLSMIPWFAAHGYLSIVQEGKQTLLNKLRPLPGDAPSYQQLLFNAFFAKGDTFDISKSSSEFGKGWQLARNSLETQYKGKLNTFESKWLLLLATFCLSLTYCFATVEPEGWIVGGMVNVLLVAFVVVVLHARGVWKNMIHFSSCAGVVASLCMLVFFGGAVLFGLMLLLTAHISFDDFYLPSSVLLGLMILMLLVILCERRLYRMTPYRRERLGEVMGLKTFILTAEESRLRMLLGQDERYFYYILPFAMAFGLVDEWAAKFKNLSVRELQEFGNAPVAHISRYVNSSSLLSNVSSSVMSYHAASGGGSGRAGGSRGGYSGGGSGGGGGHSW